MQTDTQGKILFYHEESGEGIILTKDKGKVPFKIDAWNDFEQLPQMGLTVHFKLQGSIATEISSVVSDEIPEGESEDDPSAAKASEKISVQGVIHDYFNSVYQELTPYRDYHNAEHAIDYLKLKRFLLTTYNNIIEIDRDLKTSDVTAHYKNILYLNEVYEKFKQKTKYVKQAFQEFFLNRHNEYSAASHRLEGNIESIAKYEYIAKISEISVKKLEKILKTLPSDSENYLIVQKKLKGYRAKSVDSIHAKRDLEEENAQLRKFLDLVENENEESFRELFLAQSKSFDEKIVHLLNKAAYVFDSVLWQKARKSRIIKDYFRKSNIVGQLTSLKYLQYYLQSLDKKKLSGEHKELFELIPYLQSLQQRKILYLSSEINNAMRFKSALNTLGKGIEVETTLNIDHALASIMKKMPEFLFIDKDADFKKIISVLSELEMIQETFIVLVVNTMDDKLLAKAKKFQIQDLLPMQISNGQFAETIGKIIAS